ncbi:YdcF family protein [Zooshikella harenae]|uniref:YdcF family protein n=1 Tax=Zooshikella harenae TaxID=2827238 RepID=A0ABS5Z6G9_9GAMM|nr:YdcF family protein [Zooshikella harenae]MBU2709643.1 YdcF family protein [Zooshikella harenae]
MLILYRQLHKKLIKPLMFLLIIDLLCSIAWLYYVLYPFNHNELTDSPNADALIILMGDFNNNYTALGKQTLRRLNYALTLARKKAIKNFLCVGGSRPTNNIYGAILMKQYLASQGIDEDNILAETHSYDSQTNWQNAKSIITQQGWKTVFLVSTPLHLQRFKTIIEQDPINTEVILQPISYQTAKPDVTYWELWLNVHYNWAANFSLLLPQSFRTQLLMFIRPQQ